jgi:hypothetical protein
MDGWRMKKLFLSVIFMSLLLSAPMAAGAAGVYTVTVMDTDISVELPDGYDTLTRELDQYTDIIEEYRIDRETLQNTLRGENRYLEALNRNTGNEIMIKSYMDADSIDLWSFSTQSPDVVVRSAESIGRLMGEGVAVEYFKTERGYQFLRYDDGMDNIGALIYMTVENGRYIEIAAYSYNGEYLRPEDVGALESVVQSFRVLTVFPSQDTWEDTDTQNLVAALLAAGIIAVAVTIVVVYRKTRRERLRAEWERDRLPTREELIARGALRRPEGEDAGRAVPGDAPAKPARRREEDE